MAIKVNNTTVIDDSRNLTAVTITKEGGASTQFLKADGSVSTENSITGRAIAMAIVFG